MEENLTWVPTSIFAQLTVEENLHMGAYIIDDKALVAEGVENAFEMFPRLKERRSAGRGHALRR